MFIGQQAGVTYPDATGLRIFPSPREEKEMRNPPRPEPEPSGVSGRGRLPNAPALVTELGGSYATGLCINLGTLDAAEIYKWFIAAVLYGARIPETIASRTWHEFETSGVLTPQRMLDTGWDGLVAILDRGRYVRYDYKTATKLLEINRTLLDRYGGNLNTLHAAAADSIDLEQRIMALGKGIGKVTAGIFLRELRGRWQKAAPPLSPLAFMAARTLGFIPNRIGDDHDLALVWLQHLWSEQGMTAASFSDFEAALVRQGLWLRRRAVRGSMRSGAASLAPA